MREGNIVVDGKIRKSASTLDLRVSAEDDVFGPRTPATASSASGSLNATSTGPSQEAISILNRTAQQFHRVRGYNGFKPRMDRGLEPNSANAQGLFSPDANVFVAK
jgi:hypothetical protein